jgi:hypothetical protein
MIDKMEHMEFQIGQLKEDSFTSSPSYRSTDGYDMPNGQKGEAREAIQRINVQDSRQDFPSFSDDDLEAGADVGFSSER